MGQLDFRDSSIQMLGADFAVFSARWHLTFKTGKEATGLTTVILRKLPEGWRIIYDHSSS
ncbi:MAG: hypothetical protein NVS9B15_24460 [Acidobacteriaceae bacterium]